jgi:ubiquinone/menaquinone biosynthesis C-methylase UbiE
VFLPFYDLITKVIGADRVRQEFLLEPRLEFGQRVLDVGCGTGTLAVLLKKRNPQVEVLGLDPDPKALARARKKAQRAGVSVDFVQGFADRIDQAPAWFDRVYSSFMFHHLDAATKQAMLREVRRVLKPGGRLHLLDFAGPENGQGFLSRRLHSHHRIKDNSPSYILKLLNDAGFAHARLVGSRSVLLGIGKAAYYEART